VTSQISSALAAAHQHCIVHRDPRTGSLFLVRNPVVPRGERVKRLAFFAVGLLVACASNDPDAKVIDAPAPDASNVDALAGWQASCRRYCEHRVACGNTQDLDQCITTCVRDFDAPWLRVDAGEAVLACQAALPCGESNNQCMTACLPTATHDVFETQCRLALTTCGDAAWLDRACETTGTADYPVGMLCAVNPSIIDEMIACVPTGVTCPTAEACLDGVFMAHDINF